MKEGLIIAIDYSMTCPSVCVFPRHLDFSFFACDFLIQSSSKYIKEGKAGVITQKFLPDKFESDQHRWDLISQNVLDFLPTYPPKSVIVAVEEYSFASRGNNFHVGENTGVLKHKFYKSWNIVPTTVNVTHVKKKAQAKNGGNATKFDMLMQFKEIEPEAFEWLDKNIGIVVKRKVKQTKRGEKVFEEVRSPICDIVDSYFMAKYLHENP